MVRPGTLDQSMLSILAAHVFIGLTNTVHAAEMAASFLTIIISYHKVGARALCSRGTLPDTLAQ
jgi:hypothetical protein